MSRWDPVDDSAALREARKLMRKGLSAAAAARTAAARAGTPSRATTLRTKLSREGGRRSITLTFSAEEWARIEAAAGGGPESAWARRLLLEAATAPAPTRLLPG